MNIWFVNQQAYTPYQAAGSRHFAYARELIRRGHNVHIISSSFYHKHRRQDHYDPDKIAVRDTIDGVPFIWLRIPSYKGNAKRFLSMMVYAIRVIREQGIEDLPRPDIIHCTSPSPLAGLAGRFPARKYGAAWIVEIVDLWPDVLTEVGSMKRWNPVVVFFRLIEKYLYRNADAVVTQMVGAPRHFQALGADPGKTHFIPSAAPFDPMPEAPAPPDHEGVVFAYAGAIGRSNAIGSMLDAWDLMHRTSPERARGLKLVLLGDGDERAALKKRAEAAPWAESVNFHDPIPKSEVLGFLAKTDVCLVTNKDLRIYSFGMSLNKIFDYMAAAKPSILATGAPGTPVEASGAGKIVPPEDPEALAAAILEFAEMSRETRHEMGLRGYQHLVRHHHVRSWGDQAEALFQSLIQQKSEE